MNKELQLDKKFLSNLNKTKIKCKEVSIKEISVKLKQSNVATPVIYSAKNIYYKSNARALKCSILSELNIKNSISEANINLYLPKNNNVARSIVDVKFDNFDLAPLGEYLKQYLPNDLTNISGVIDVRVNKKNLVATLENCAIIMKDNAKSIIFQKKLQIN